VILSYSERKKYLKNIYFSSWTLEVSSYYHRCRFISADSEPENKDSTHPGD